MRRPSRPWWTAIAAGTALAALGVVGAPRAEAATVIDCSQAATRVQITGDVELDPTCTYTAGFDLTASGASLDCKGARIAAPAGVGGYGIGIVTPVDVALDDASVRNCHVSGFVNSLRVTRTGFRDLPDGAEFEHPTSDITVEDSSFRDSRGVGVYVDGYVSDVTIRRNEITGTGSSGIYLETGSKENLVVDNQIRDNGFRENGPGGQTIEVGGTTLWFWGIGREGISVDGSSDNEIVGNTFSGNSAGAIFLYKNCGEYPGSGRYFERRDPADRNLIEGNRFEGGRIGVWVASRMGENTLPMECTDAAYLDTPGRRVVRDFAKDNVIRANAFEDVTYGVLVEDDRTTVEGNEFVAGSPDHHAVIVGTPDRTVVLGEPVAGTVLRDNVADIDGNDSPYRWVHGEEGSTVESNRALGAAVGWCEGEPIPRTPFIFAIAIAAAGPDGERPPRPGTQLEDLGALPSCWADPLPSPANPVLPGAPTSPATLATPAEPLAGSPSYTG